MNKLEEVVLNLYLTKKKVRENKNEDQTQELLENYVNAEHEINLLGKQLHLEYLRIEKASISCDEHK